MKFFELVKISCFLVSFAALCRVSNAIECYQCNSEYDPRCGDPFDPYSLGKVNCSMKTGLEHLPGKEPVLCRKTTQKIFGKKRVVRDCGYLNDEWVDKECVKRSGTFEVQSLFCSCTSDLCNAAPSTHQLSIFGLSISIAITTGLLSLFKSKFQ